MSGRPGPKLDSTEKMVNFKMLFLVGRENEYSVFLFLLLKLLTGYRNKSFGMVSNCWRCRTRRLQCIVSAS